MSNRGEVEYVPVTPCTSQAALERGARQESGCLQGLADASLAVAANGTGAGVAAASGIGTHLMQFSSLPSGPGGRSEWEGLSWRC